MVSNVIPKINIPAAKETYNTNSGLYCFTITIIINEVNPIPIKTAMAAMGFCKDIFRLPLCNPDDDHKKLIVECVNRMMNDIKEGKDGNN